MTIDELNKTVCYLFDKNKKLTREEFVDLIELHKKTYQQKANEMLEQGKGDLALKYKGRFWALVRVSSLLDLLEG